MKARIRNIEVFLYLNLATAKGQKCRDCRAFRRVHCQLRRRSLVLTLLLVGAGDAVGWLTRAWCCCAIFKGHSRLARERRAGVIDDRRAGGIVDWSRNHLRQRGIISHFPRE